jgi:hypothetical protein
VRELRLLKADELAAVLGVDRSYVYEHADELGAWRLGSGSRARLRFDLADVRRRLTSCALRAGGRSTRKTALLSGAGL